MIFSKTFYDFGFLEKFFFKHFIKIYYNLSKNNITVIFLNTYFEKIIFTKKNPIIYQYLTNLLIIFH